MEFEISGSLRFTLYPLPLTMPNATQDPYPYGLPRRVTRARGGRVGQGAARGPARSHGRGLERPRALGALVPPLLRFLPSPAPLLAPSLGLDRGPPAPVALDRPRLALPQGRAAVVQPHRDVR